MDERTADKIIEATHWPRAFAATALGVLALFLLVATMNELKSYRYIGSGISATDTIQVDGQGIVYAVPDTATFSVTVEDTASDVATAQSKATADGNAVVDYLKQQGIADTDIQTTDYEINPQYSYSSGICEVAPVPVGENGTSGSASYCPPGKQVLTGYQVSETLSVKVRDTSKAGDLLSGVGKLGASQVSGLSFTVADEQALQSQARDKAIQDAQSQAQTLAGQLGVSLVRIVGFSDNSGGRVVPMYAMSAAGSTASAPAPEIQTGQNQIEDDVTVTYEIQ